jgi:hypothetical protein
MSKKDVLIAKIMKQCEADGEPVTREEAEEMAEMELKANTGAIAKAEAVKTRKPRKSPEKDPEKVEIIKKLCDFLLTNGEEDATIVNEQREISFRGYSIQLIKHRVKKEDK